MATSGARRSSIVRSRVRIGGVRARNRCAQIGDDRAREHRDTVPNAKLSVSQAGRGVIAHATACGCAGIEADRMHTFNLVGHGGVHPTAEDQEVMAGEGARRGLHLWKPRPRGDSADLRGHQC